MFSNEKSAILKDSSGILSESSSLTAVTLTSTKSQISLSHSKENLFASNTNVIEKLETHKYTKYLKHLRKILNELRVELNYLIEIYNRIIIDYQELIPRDNYNRLFIKYSKLEIEYEKFLKTKEKLNTVHENLIKMNNEVKQKYNELYECNHLLHHSSTPRPDWSRCAKILDGGIEKWSLISNDKSSDELVDVLINEFHGNQNSNFRLRLSSITVNKSCIEVNERENEHLKKKYIFNRKLNRRELGLLIHEIWSAKIINDLENRLKGQFKRESMNQFCIRYLNKKFNSTKLANEHYFNIKEACSRFYDYTDAAYFLMVLNHDADEEIYHKFYSYCGRLYQSIKNSHSNELHNNSIANANINILNSKVKRQIKLKPIKNEQTFNKPTSMTTAPLIVPSTVTANSTYSRNMDNNDFISLDEFQMIIEKLFPWKTQANVNELIKAANEEIIEKYFILNKQSTNLVNIEFIEFKLLFLINDDGKLGKFLSTLKQQFDNERDIYIEKIFKKFDKFDNKVNLNDFKVCMKEIDENISEEELNDYSNWIFNESNVIEKYEFIKRVQYVNLYNEKIGNILI